MRFEKTVVLRHAHNTRLAAPRGAAVPSTVSSEITSQDAGRHASREGNSTAYVFVRTDASRGGSTGKGSTGGGSRR